MSDLERTSRPASPSNGHAAVRRVVSLRGAGDDDGRGGPSTRPKIKWLRLLAILGGLAVLAVVSTVFGMMMAVTSDLPRLDVFDTQEKRPSVVVSRDGRRLGELTGSQRRILVSSEQIAPVMKQAIIAIEDRRFYEHSGVDLRGIARALWQDIVARKAVQGGSTITQQLVKNRLEAQNQRTVFQKLRESAIAFHMTRKWDKQRILTNYLNTIYFGNGAYGIEAAARTYFGSQHVGCGERGGRTCAQELEPAEAALIAGIVASPSAYDPIANPEAARRRRDLVLLRMREQGYLGEPLYRSAIAEPIPAKADIMPPREETRFPYFTTWVRQQVVDRVGAGLAFEGGLEVRTTIDARLQQAAERAVGTYLGTNRAPASALVALDNDSGEVLAMVGGPLGDEGYNERPFNLATQGQRQPGSAFKPFVLAEALRQGISPNSVWTSSKKEFCIQRRRGTCRERFVVNNYEGRYAGAQSLAQATAFSDNSVYAELGLEIGIRKVARLARRMGIRTPVSDNPAITLGGLRQGVTVLDMAHAYTALANGGRLPYGTLSPGAGQEDEPPGPVGIRRIVDGDGDPVEALDGKEAKNERRGRRVLPASVARTATEMLQGVVRYGTGTRASLGPDVMAAGKTGTTEDYGDAWFVGYTEHYTVAVWVGFPDEVKPMEPPLFSYQGDPVAGGTYPAAIWQAFMREAEALWDREHPGEDDEDTAPIPSTPTGPPPSAPAAPTPAPAPSGEGDDSPDPAPAEPQPPPEEPPPAAQPAPDPDGAAEPAPPGGGTTAPPAGGTQTP